MKKKGPGLPDEASAALLHGRAQRISQVLGYDFVDPGLLLRALTHPSASPTENNQRLEFLGDAVLQLCVSRLLYERFKEGEGGLTMRRQRLVSAGALTKIALEINLGESVHMDSPLERQGGRQHPGVLSDALEAVLGAVFLDGDLAAADSVVRRLWAKAVEEADAKLDPKGTLQAWAAAKGLPEPVYSVEMALGTLTNPVYASSVSVGSRIMGTGRGHTKRAAQAAAAEEALAHIQQAEVHGETGEA